MDHLLNVFITLRKTILSDKTDDNFMKISIGSSANMGVPVWTKAPKMRTRLETCQSLLLKYAFNTTFGGHLEFSDMFFHVVSGAVTLRVAQQKVTS